MNLKLERNPITHVPELRHNVPVQSLKRKPHLTTSRSIYKKFELLKTKGMAKRASIEKSTMTS